MVGLQSSSSSIWTWHNANFTQKFFPKRLAVTMAVRSPFIYKLKWETKFKDPTFYLVSKNYSRIRFFRMNVSYQFGKLKGGIKKAKRGIKNEDVKGGESGGTGETGN